MGQVMTYYHGDHRGFGGSNHPRVEAVFPDRGDPRRYGYGDHGHGRGGNEQQAATPQGAPGDHAKFRAPDARVAQFSLGALLNGSGAVLSLALIAGLGWWSWQLVARDVTGVPVVRALEGPMRVAPEDAGGQRAQFQGLSVNEIPAGNAAGGVGAELVLAPRPVDLTDEDIPQAARSVATQSSANPGAQLIEAAWRPDSPTPGTEPARTESIATPPPPGSVVAVESSPRPPARPASMQRPSGTAASASGDDIAQAVASNVALRTSPQIGREVDPATLTPGTRLVQLGTYPSADDARTAWASIAQRFNPLLDDRGRVIESAHSGGSVFYRLRVHGFEDEADSRRFCAVLLGQNNDCIPVLIR